MWEVFDMHLETWSREIIDLAGWYGNTQLSFLRSTFYENPWFTRVWVIQEGLSAQKPFIHCSGEQVPWEEVVQVSKWLEHPRYAGQSPHIASQQTTMAAIWKTLRPKGGTREVPITPIEAQGTSELRASWKISFRVLISRQRILETSSSLYSLLQMRHTTLHGWVS
jgi:hypothetical protein